MALAEYFDRVVLINLKRRADRLARVLEALRQCDWPFLQPEVFEAIDGHALQPPNFWKSSPGAWGCLQSHRSALGMAIADGIKNILVLEDDICFADGFGVKVREFIGAIPPDWDQLMLGGQHVNLTGQLPELAKPGVYRCTDCERTHCYAVRGEYMRKLYQRWGGGGKYNGSVHCDWIMGRDPELQLAHKVYAPVRFLVGQNGGRSDVDENRKIRKFWNPPDPGTPIINIHASAAVISELQAFGFYTGRDLDPISGIDKKLEQIFVYTANNQLKRIRRLALWIAEMQWDVASNPGWICAIWHPQATRELVQAASSWPVYDIVASSAKEVIEQMPGNFLSVSSRSEHH